MKKNLIEEGMLKKFEVTNFKGFKDKLVLDLTDHRDYEFNSNFIKNDIINKALIYGKNGSGKSNLGYAIFDITYHLTDKMKDPMNGSYINGDSDKNFATFVYEFQFNNNEVKYEYAKFSRTSMMYEKFYVNNELVIYYDFLTKKFSNLSLKGAENLNKNLSDNIKSVVRYIYSNSILEENSPLRLMMDFVDRMLWFRCMDKGPEFTGYMQLPKMMAEMITDNGSIEDYEKFLSDNEIFYDINIKREVTNNLPLLVAELKKGQYSLDTIWSTGTRALTLFYCWSLEFNKVSFLFLDEFDAFYHYETSEYILTLINQNENLQALVTSHNTFLMNNKLTRPDCCFIISNNHIKNLCNATDKDIREAHNLEKMYRNGIFVDI